MRCRQIDPEIIKELQGEEMSTVSELQIKVIKLHPDAVLPQQANDTDAGYDLVAVDDGKDFYGDVGNYIYTEYDTGLAIEPPSGYHTEIIPRSSITKKNLILKNSFGLIDNSYRGPLRFRFHKTGDVTTTNVYKKGDKIGQIIIRKTIHMPFVFVDKLNETVRGTGGFGSTDKK